MVHRDASASRRIGGPRTAPATYGILAVSIVGFVLQMLTADPVLVLRTSAIEAVWTWVGHLFVYAGMSHILWFGVFLLLFGRPIERAIGTKRFLTAFLSFGVLTGLAHVLLLSLVGLSGGTVGADRALLGLLVTAATYNPALSIASRSIPVLYALLVGLLVVTDVLRGLGFSGQYQVAGTVFAVLLGLGYAAVLRHRGVDIEELRIV